MVPRTRNSIEGSSVAHFPVKGFTKPLVTVSVARTFCTGGLGAGPSRGRRCPPGASPNSFSGASSPLVSGESGGRSERTLTPQASSAVGLFWCKDDDARTRGPSVRPSQLGFRGRPAFSSSPAPTQGPRLPPAPPARNRGSLPRRRVGRTLAPRPEGRRRRRAADAADPANATQTRDPSAGSTNFLSCSSCSSDHARPEGSGWESAPCGEGGGRRWTKVRPPRPPHPRRHGPPASTSAGEGRGAPTGPGRASGRGPAASEGSPAREGGAAGARGARAGRTPRRGGSAEEGTRARRPPPAPARAQRRRSPRPSQPGDHPRGTRAPTPAAVSHTHLLASPRTME